MANERTHTTQEYYLSLTQFTPSDLDQAASVMEKEDRKEDDQTLLFQILQGKKSNIPTLVKFIDAQGSHHYYLFGLSENGTEILTPIPTNLEGASAAINATYHPLRLSAKLDGINFSTYKGGRPRSLLISAANEDNSEIYEAILSLAPDHSFFPALIHRHIPELVGAFASLPKNRNKSICNTVLKLGIDLIEYFKTKKLALSPEIIANFMQNIGILYFSPETSTQLFSHIGAINRLHDHAYLALHRSKRSLQDDDEDEEYDRQPQGFIGSLRDVINKLFNSGYQELQQDNKQESKEDGNYSSTAKQQRTLSKLTEPADMGLDDIYKQPTTEQERIAQAFYVAGEVLRNISDSVTDQKPNPFSALLTPEILNAYSIASNTESAIREDLLPLPTEKPHAAVAAESLKKDDKDNAEPNKTALIIYGRSLLEALEQNNPDPKMIVDAFITLLTKLSATETDDKISNLAKDLSLGEILAALRKHHDIFRQLRNTVNTFSTKDRTCWQTLGHLRNCVRWLDRLLKRPEWQKDFSDFSEVMLDTNICSLQHTLIQPGYPSLAYPITPADLADAELAWQRKRHTSISYSSASPTYAASSPKSPSSPKSAFSPRSPRSPLTREGYLLHLMEIQKSNQQLEDVAAFILEHVKQNAEIPTLVKFGDAYYVYGCSIVENELKQTVRLIVDGSEKGNKKTKRKKALLAKLNALNFKEKHSIGISPANNSSIYNAILSINNEHSLLPAVLDRYIPALIQACQTRNPTEISNAFVFLARYLNSYLRKKGLLTAANVSDFVQIISAHPSSHSLAQALAAHAGSLGKLGAVITAYEFQISNPADGAQSPSSSKMEATRPLKLANAFLMGLIESATDKEDKDEVERFKTALANALAPHVREEEGSVTPGDPVEKLTRHAELLQDIFQVTKDMREGTRHREIVRYLIPLSKKLDIKRIPNDSELAKNEKAVDAFLALNEFEPTTIQNLCRAIDALVSDATATLRASKALDQSQPIDKTTLEQYKAVSRYLKLIHSTLRQCIWEQKLADTFKSGLEDPSSPTNQQPITIAKILFYIFYFIPFPLATLQRGIPISKKRNSGWIVLDILLLPLLPPDKLAEKYELEGGSQLFIRIPYTLFWIASAGVFPIFFEHSSLIMIASLVGISHMPLFMALAMFAVMIYHQASSYVLHHYAQPKIRNMRLLGDLSEISNRRDSMYQSFSQPPPLSPKRSAARRANSRETDVLFASLPNPPAIRRYKSEFVAVPPPPAIKRFSSVSVTPPTALNIERSSSAFVAVPAALNIERSSSIFRSLLLGKQKDSSQTKPIEENKNSDSSNNPSRQVNLKRRPSMQSSPLITTGNESADAGNFTNHAKSQLDLSTNDNSAMSPSDLSLHLKREEKEATTTPHLSPSLKTDVTKQPNNDGEYNTALQQVFVIQQSLQENKHEESSEQYMAATVSQDEIGQITPTKMERHQSSSSTGPFWNEQRTKLPAETPENPQPTVKPGPPTKLKPTT